ncbi:molecular chaperone DnaJ [Cladophialophora yegresii CBS 114405]|uniref:DnaJ homolog 1, mitochondrial n=1 Tax=Cladophialophora yegresii CBS 114405 TaxID=1182544 RepID=W9VQI1_9EURO|nr:molecular chaperone DnaJ [Cladophialophora yegresii CBS 114405]EXJ57972.1 molecular chaperone DnaJ [Cladophialophora yegresii CBS 114405]
MSVIATPTALGGTAPLRSLLRTTSQCPRQRNSFTRKAQTRRFYDSAAPKRPVPQRSSSASPRCPSHHRRPFSATPAFQATKDPYATLGVGKNATAPEIKKAYYALAKKYHPDTNKDPGAKEKFTDAQSAYELLNDPQKKAAYDQFGAAAFDQGAGFDPSAGGGNPFAGAGGGNPFSGFGGGFGAEFNFEDLFGAFTGGGRRGRRGGGPFQEEILVGENIEVQTNISFMDAAKGVSKNITITPLVQCGTCKGDGMKQGSSRQTCKRCNGTGTRVHVMQAGFQMASTCDTCNGTGTVVPRGSECNTCSGNGVVRKRETVEVDIPGGVEDGMRLRVAGSGDYPPTGLSANPKLRTQRGDLYVFIRVAPDARFSRNGADILYTASIPLTTALLGGEVMVPTLDGEVRVKVATGTSTNDRITLGGMGMKRLGGRGAGSSGDLRVEFKVQMPKYLTANQRTIIEMLADEMGDKTAKRIMNVGRYKDQDKQAPGNDSPASKPSEKRADHKNEGFLKSAWHKLTHQHDNLESDKPGKESKAEQHEDNEPEKASGSG